MATAIQVKSLIMPVVREKHSEEFVTVTDEMKAFNAYATLRAARTNKKHMGKRLKKLAEAEKEEKK